MTLNYDDLFQEHLLDKVENKALTDIKEMLEKRVESLTKVVVDRNAPINRLSETISRMVVDAQKKEQELREKERVLSDRYDIIAKQIDKIVVLRDAIHCMQGEAREKDAALEEHYDTIMRQAGKLLKLQQQRAEIYEASKEWVAMYGTSSIMPRQTQELLNKLKEVFTYDRYCINEETNEWVGGCEKRVGYDDSQGQTPPGYGSTEPTRKTPGSPKQSYDYRKVGL